MTASYPSEQVGGFVVNQNSKSSLFLEPARATWCNRLCDSPFDDADSGKPFREFVTRDNEVRDVLLQGGRTYWAKFRAAPAEDNDSFKTTSEITVEFEVPGNPLPQPQNTLRSTVTERLLSNGSQLLLMLENFHT